MKRTSLFLACAMALTSCAEKTVAPIPTPMMAAHSGKSISSLQQGHTLYLSHCSRCHEAQLPDSVSSEDWHVVVPGMAWNAGLSKADERAILNYILAAKSHR